MSLMPRGFLALYHETHLLTQHFPILPSQEWDSSYSNIGSLTQSVSLLVMSVQSHNSLTS